MYWGLVFAGAVLYAVLLVLVVGVQLPRFRWKFHMSPAVIVHAYADGDPPASTSETHRALALIIDENIKHNTSNLNRMHRVLGLSLVLLVLEIAAWAILVARTA